MGVEDLAVCLDGAQHVSRVVRRDEATIRRTERVVAARAVVGRRAQQHPVAGLRPDLALDAVLVVLPRPAAGRLGDLFAAIKLRAEPFYEIPGHRTSSIFEATARIQRTHPSVPP